MGSQGNTRIAKAVFTALLAVSLLVGLFFGTNYARGQALQAKWTAASQQPAGRDPVQWWLSRGLNAEKTHKGIFAGVNLTYIYDKSGLNAVLTLTPRTNLSTIQFRFDDLQSLSIDGNGEASLQTALGSFRLGAPSLSQTLSGQIIPLSGGYQQSQRNRLGFWASTFDANQPLEIRFRMEVLQQETAVITPPRAPEVVTIGATKVDSLFNDVDGDTKADPGDTLQYAVTITNSGDEDATGVQFNDTIDANTTLVPGSVDTTPLAIADAYSAVGNVRIQVPVGSGLLANDTEPDGTGGLTATPQTITSTNGGDVTINADGSFAFNPFPGFTGTDSFNYTLNDGEGNTDIGTATITVAGMIWFIDNTNVTAPDGRLTNPFTSIAQFNATAADDPGDNIFIFESIVNFYTGPITILNSQRLIGQDSTSTLSAITGIVPPSFSDPFPVTNSANGIVAQIQSAGTAITLALNNTLNGFSVGNSSTAIDGTSFSTLSVADVIINTNGRALNLDTGTVGGTGFTSVTASGGSNNVRLVNLSGNLNLGTGAMSGASSHAFFVDGGNGSITYNGTIQDDTGPVVNVANKTGGTVTFGGAITGDSFGVTLNTNPGATINFTGGMNLSTGANPAFSAAGGGTVNATQNNTTIVNTLTTTTGTALNVANTTIGASNLTFRSISSNGATNGILLNATGTSGGLVVTGNGGTCSSAATCTGGAIQNATVGVSLTNTTGVSVDRMFIQNTSDSGIKGTTVTNFTFTNGAIDNSGTALGAETSNIAFNTTAAGTENNLSGLVTITGNILTNAFYHGIDIFNFNGTISDANISSNTITSTTSTATSKGTGIRLVAFGSAATIANVTTATITNNIISNFPSASGILASGGNGNLAGPTGIFGVAGSATDIITITGNSLVGNPKFGTFAIAATVNGRGQGNFNISNNGTLANPITNTIGTAIAVSSFGFANVTAAVNNNFIVANNNVGAQGIGVGTGVVINNTETPTLTITINGNNISQTDGNGILAVARDATGQLNVAIKNNTVAAPLGGVRPGIRIDAGNAISADDAVCLDISGNTSAGSGGSQGIGLRKQGTSTAINDFSVEGMVATDSPGVEAYIDSLNPAGGGTLLISATSGFSNCSTAPIVQLDGSEAISKDKTGVTHVSNSQSNAEEAIGVLVPLQISKTEEPPNNAKIQARNHLDSLVSQASLKSRFRAQVVPAIQKQSRKSTITPVSLLAPTSGETINLTIGTLPFGKSITVKFRAVIDLPFPQGVGQVCNQATISGSNFSNVLSDDPDVGGAADPTCTTLAQADLAVTKTDSPDPVPVGNNITYTINFVNNGPDGATNVNVTDAVPANTTFVSAAVTTGTGWTVNTPPVGGTGNVTFDKAAVAAAETATFEIVVQTNAGLPDGTIISNTVITTSETPDGNTADNGDTETTLVQAPADIAVTKTDSPDPVIAGNNITYTINFVNNGPNASNNVSVTDATPANTTFVSASVISGTGWSTSTPAVGGTGTISFDKALVATSETATFQIVVNVNANTADATIISNTVNATSTTLDNDLSNNTDTETTTVQSRADLVVTKSDSPDPVVAGTNLTYTIDFVNNGPSNAAGVNVADATPANTTFVSAMAPAGWTSTTPPIGGTGTITFTKATVLPGETAQFIIVVNVNANTLNGTIITNNAVASATTQDDTPGNNTATATTTVIAQADLSITKSDSPDPVDAGANITYTLDFANAGPSDAQGVSVTDATPANTTFVSATAPAGWTTNTPPVGGTGTISFTKATSAAGEVAQFTIVVNVDSDTADAATISNTVDVTSSTTDTNTANNSDTETTTVQTSADLSITKTDSPDPVAAGTNLTYTLDFTNNGPSDAQNVSIGDAVPTNTTFVSATAPAGWTATTPPVGGTGNVVFDKTSVTAGETAQFSIVVAIAADVPDATIITNTATVTTDTTDPTPANNSDTETTTVNASSDLSVTKVDSIDPATAGQNLTYTINFANSGPSDAQNVDVSDPLPAFTTFVSATVTSGSGWAITSPPVGTNGTVSFTKATVLSTETATFEIVVLIDLATPDNTILSNTVTATSDSADPNPGNDSDTETTLVREPSDLSITKDDGETDVSPGQSITYTIVASNVGRDDPAAVVADDLPAELLNVTWTCVGSGGGICAPSGNGDINETVNLPDGASVTFTVNATIDFAAMNQIVNTATVTPGPDITDPDPSNNTATDTDTIVCLFCDEFNDSTLNLSWTYVKSINQWIEDGNNLVGANDKKTRATAEGVFAGCSTCTIFTSMQTAGGQFNRVSAYGWWVDKDTHVELLMKQESGTWVLKQRVAGDVVAKQNVKLTILPNTPYSVRITFNGTEFQVFIDGSSTPDITLTAVTAPNGSVGFRVKGTIGTFDFIRVF